MPTIITARDRMIRDYKLLDAQLQLDAARDQLRDSSGWGVVVDPAGSPSALVTVAVLDHALQHPSGGQAVVTLAAAHALLPPLVLIHADLPLAQVVEQPQMTALRYGAAGMVVVDAQAIAGVLTRQAIASYLAKEYRPSGTLADATLPGVIVTPTMNVTCATCQFVNKLDEVDPDNLPECLNRHVPPGPHILVLGWL